MCCGLAVLFSESRLGRGLRPSGFSGKAGIFDIAAEEQTVDVKMLLASAIQKHAEEIT